MLIALIIPSEYKKMANFVNNPYVNNEVVKKKKKTKAGTIFAPAFALWIAKSFRI